MSRNRTVLSAVLILVTAHALALMAGVFAPYDSSGQDRDRPYAPPMRLHFVDKAGKWHARPFVYAWNAEPGAFARYQEDRSRSYALRFFVRVPREQFGEPPSSELRLVGVDSPGRWLLLGTDGYGRDQFSRLLYGGRISLFAGLLAAALSLGLGALIGTVAGYYGRSVDSVLMRLTEIFLAMPWLYLLLAVRAFLPLRISPEAAFFLLIAVIGTVGWARPARLVRGVVLSAKERNYVLAARGFGASKFYLMRRHVLPQVSGVILTQAALLVPQFILAEVALSFFGLGVVEPTPSWGNMLASVQQYSVLASYWWMLAPALVLIPVTWAYSVVANAFHERTVL